MTIDQVPSMEEILAVHGDGIAAIAEIAGRLDDAWDRQTPCDGWTAQDPDLPIPVAVQDLCAIPLTVRLFAWVAGGEWARPCLGLRAGDRRELPHCPR